MTDPPLLVFDVNETLLDLDALAPQFERIFGHREVLREWFAQLILYSEALTLSGNYASFGELGGAVLQMVAAVREVRVTADDLHQLKEAVATMPPHVDVQTALVTLRDAGFRLFTLTNNPIETCGRQLELAGIAHFFEQQFSVDGVRRYKPAREVYSAVERSLGVPPAHLLLIACHAWDIMGAAAAGWKTALILRPGNAVLGVGGQPHITGKDLSGVANQLIAQFKK